MNEQRLSSRHLTANENKWELDEKAFGPLWPYIIDKNITDIDWDSTELWIKDVNGKDTRVYLEGVDEMFVENFTERVSNHENRTFNKTDKILYADTDTLRITCAHEELAISGRCFSIRKSLPGLRFTAEEAIKQGICNEEVLHLLINCIDALFNIAIGGEPGHGKTELAKFTSSYIKPEQKVITVEDTKEWHYKKINPGKRCIEIKVDNHAEYEKTLEVAVRLNPTWLMVSEARGKEVKFIIAGWRTGVRGITTLHTDDVRNIPDRMIGMMGESFDEKTTENTIYTYLDVGIHMKQEVDEHGTFRRKVNQVAFYYRDGKENKCAVIVEDGELYKENIPEVIKEKFRKKGIDDMFYNKTLNKELHRKL